MNEKDEKPTLKMVQSEDRDELFGSTPCSVRLRRTNLTGANGFHWEASLAAPRSGYESDEQAALAAGKAALLAMHASVVDHFAPVLRWEQSGPGDHIGWHATIGSWILSVTTDGWTVSAGSDPAWVEDSFATGFQSMRESMRAAEAALRGLGVPFRTELAEPQPDLSGIKWSELKDARPQIDGECAATVGSFWLMAYPSGKWFVFPATGGMVVDQGEASVPTLEAARDAAEQAVRALHSKMSKILGPVLRWRGELGEIAELGWQLWAYQGGFTMRNIITGFEGRWADLSSRDANRRAAEAALRAMGVPFRVEER